MNLTIRRFDARDAENVSNLIRRTLREVNIRDYSKEYIDRTCDEITAEYIAGRAMWTHFYVIEEKEKIVGCGAIGPYWDVPEEYSLFTIFVLPEYQGQGVGRLIINALEQDEYFLKAKRVEIPASITAVPFYQKFGYDYKNGAAQPDEEGLIRLEKRR